MSSNYYCRALINDKPIFRESLLEIGDDYIEIKYFKEGGSKTPEQKTINYIDHDDIKLLDGKEIEFSLFINKSATQSRKCVLRLIQDPQDKYEQTIIKLVFESDMWIYE